jgi:hypothetical protein
VLPVGCGPPCNLTLTTHQQEEDGEEQQQVVVVVNQPQIAWVQQNGPLYPGGTLRVFGRGLAWDTPIDGAWQCINGSGLSTVSSTKLEIHSTHHLHPRHLLSSPSTPSPFSADDAAALRIPLATVSAKTANCYEASFILPATLPAGSYTPSLLTPWGSATIPLEIITLPPPRKELVVDVDVDYGGDVRAALQAAANVTADGSTPPTSVTVQLSNRVCVDVHPNP